MESRKRLRLDPNIAPVGSAESYVLIVLFYLIYWAYAGLGRDLVINRFVDPTATDWIGQYLTYVRFTLTALASLYVAAKLGFDWVAARLPFQFAPFIVFATLSATWADSWTIALQNAIIGATLWISVTALVHRMGAPAAVVSSLCLIAGVNIVSFLLAVLMPSVGVHSGAEFVQSGHAGRWRGIFAHKNSLGPWAAFGAVLLFTHSWMAGRGHAFFWWFARVAAVACLVFSGSATSLVMAMSLVATWVFLRALRTMAGYTVLLIAVTAALCGAAVVYLLGDTVFALLGRDSSLTGRSEIWALAADYFWEEPLIGQGFQMYGGPTFKQMVEMTIMQAIPGAESGYLTLLLDLGIVGFSLFFIPYLRAIRNGFEWLRHLRGEERGAVEFMLMTVIACLVLGITETSAFMVNGYDGVISFGSIFFLMTLPKSPLSVARATFRQAENWVPAARAAPQDLGR